MTAHINEDELKLLTYLHEHAKGFTEQFSFAPDELERELGIDEEKLKKDASYLHDHGLARMRTLDKTTYAGLSFTLVGVWLTGLGENYMRSLEAQPSIGRKLTVGAVSELWAMGKGAIVSTAGQLLSEFARHHGL